MFSVTWSRGTKANNKSGAVNDIGGHASHSKIDVAKSLKYNFCTLY